MIECEEDEVFQKGIGVYFMEMAVVAPYGVEERTAATPFEEGEGNVLLAPLTSGTRRIVWGSRDNLRCVWK